MRVAIPMRDGSFSPHFGQSNELFLCEVDLAAQRADRPRTIQRQARGCESLPQWLADLAVEQVVVGGIGAGAIEGLAARGINISAGRDGATPDDVLRSFFSDPEGAENAACSGHDHHTHHCRHD